MLSIGSFESDRHSAPAADDKEPLVGRAVSVAKYKGKWFEIDLPYILRQAVDKEDVDLVVRLPRRRNLTARQGRCPAP